MSKPFTAYDYARDWSCKFVAFVSAIATVVAIFVLMAHFGVFDVTCPSVEGRLCNGRGTCDGRGNCLCTDPFFSGPSCEITKCPGYSKVAGTVCSNSGWCGATLATRDDIPAACQETLPSASNGFRKSGGWDSLACEIELNSRWARIETASSNFDVTDLLQMPVCQCFSEATGAYGEACDRNFCPQDVAYRVCSDAGNKSVTYTSNFTSSGNGCQCQQIVHPLSDAVLNTFDDDGKRRIASEFSSVLARPLCGEIYEHPTNKNLKLIWRPRYAVVDFQKSPFRCYCDERHFGEVCEHGVCPDVDGRPCGGHGHRSFGFGRAANSTRSTSAYGEPCEPICAPGSFRCPSKNECVSDVRLCDVAERACPESRPLRCRSTACAAIPTNPLIDLCALGYQYGVYDRPENARKTPCRVFDATTFELEEDFNASVRACAGSEGYQEDDQFVPGGSYRFASSLLWFRMYANLSGVDEGEFVELTYRGRSFRTNETGYFTGIFEETYEDAERRSFEAFADADVAETSSDDEVEVVPAPFLYDGSRLFPPEHPYVRLKSADGRVVVLETTRSYARLSSSVTPHGKILANLTGDRYLKPYGEIVSSERCLSNLASCVWERTLLSPDGNRKLCDSTSNPLSISCTNSHSYRYVDTVFVGRRRVANVDLSGSWKIESHVGTTGIDSGEDFAEITSSGAKIDRVSFVERNDLAVPCACAPAGKNASELDKEWFADPERAFVFDVGDYVVASVFSYGDSRIVRGVASSPTTVAVPGYAEALTFDAAKRLNERDYGRGVPSDSLDVFPGVCPQGTSASLTRTTSSTSDATCSCDVSASRSTICDCSDVWTGPFVCECAVDECACSDVDDVVFETALAADVFGFNGTCFLKRTTESTTVSYVRSTDVVNETTFSEPAWSAFLLEVRFHPCDVDAVYSLWGKASTFSDVYEEVTSTSSYCVDGGNGTLRPVVDADVEYDSWKFSFEGSTLDFVEAAFAPNGASLFVSENVTTTASSNSADAENVEWNDDLYWSSNASDPNPFVRLDFETSARITGVFLSLRTVGINATASSKIPVAIFLQASEYPGVDDRDSKSWITLKRIVSDVYEGKEETYADLYTAAHGKRWYALRLRSFYPLSVRQFVPVTDQKCSLGSLIPSATFEGMIENALSDLVNRSSKFDDASDCQCEDVCFLEGRPASTEVCSDEKYAVDVLGRDAVSRVAESSYTAKSFAELVFNVTSSSNDPHFKVYEDDLIVWFLPGGTSSPDDVAFPSADNLDVANYTSDFYYHRGKTTFDNLTIDFADGSVVFFGTRTLLESGQVCPTGTQCTPCGSSNRVAAVDPGASCLLTNFEREVVADLANRTDYVARETRFVDEFLETGKVTLRRTFSHVRAIDVLTRSDCFDCGERFACSDGSCASDPADCPTARYDCPGDGCVAFDVNERKYKCACERGWGSLDCSASTCVPGDATTNEVDPHLWCACGGPPPLSVRPPFSLVRPEKGYYDVADLRSLKRSGAEIAATFAPYYVKIVRSFERGNRTFYTTCPFAARGPFGQRLSYEACRAENDASWRDFAKPGGGTTTVEWPSDEFSVDDFPFRCPEGQCVANLRECYNERYAHPVCGSGKASSCRVDGTCECDFGKRTFVYSEAYTSKFVVPYDENNPVARPKSRPELYGYDFADNVCRARNCSEVDCGIPMGCFPGTPGKRFEDRHVVCPATSRHSGKCAADYASCVAGEVTEPLVCYGRGLPRNRKERPDEKYCQCGDLRTYVTDLTRDPFVEVRQTTELKRNGWGGEVCDQYLCQDDPRGIRYARLDPFTGTPFVDDVGVDLPGKWIGFCGVPIGPRKSDETLWRQKGCCDGDDPLERCEKVVCGVAGIPKCVDVEECTGEEKVPWVFPCHDEGVGRADGTCYCERNTKTGTGWAPDASQFSDDQGCYREIKCGTAADGGVCNENADRVKFWTDLPKIEYLENMICPLAYREGLSCSKRDLVRRIAPSFDGGRRAKKQALADVGLTILRQIADATADVCVKPDDDPSDPVGMLPYDDRVDVVGPYGKAFKSPYLFDDFATTTASSILFDGRTVVEQSEFSKSPAEGTEYYVFTRTAVDSSSSSATFTFSSNVTISAIRIHGRALHDHYAYVNFLDGNDVPLCPRLRVDPTANYDWVGAERVHYCVPRYADYDFVANAFDDFVVNCQDDEASEKCLQWKDSTCSGTTLAEIRYPNSSDLFLGCSSRCCVSTSAAYSPTTTLKLIVSIEGATESEANAYPRYSIAVTELAIFGHGDSTVELGQGLKDEMIHLSGSSSCTDAANMARLFAEDGTDYVFVNYSSTSKKPASDLDQASASEACSYSGGRLASSRGAEDSNNYALFFGTTCFEKTTDGVAEDPEDACRVDARNDDELYEPATKDFFEEACSTDGCWVCPDGEGAECPKYQIDYVSTPHFDDGARWKLPWASGSHKAWSAYVKAAFQEGERQRSMLPEQPLERWLKYSSRRRVTKKVGRSSAQDNYVVEVVPAEAWIPKTFYSRYQSTYEPRWAVPSNVGFDRAVKFEGSIRAKDAGLGGVATYWTNPKTCRVSVYLEQNCGKWFKDGAGGKARKDFYVTPANDYWNLHRDVFYQDDGNVFVDHYDKCGNPLTLNCFHRGTPLVNHGLSISVEGPCIAVLSGTKGGKPFTYALAENQKLGTGGDGVIGVNDGDVERRAFEISKYTSTPMTSVPKMEWIWGCWPQCQNYVGICGPIDWLGLYFDFDVLASHPTHAPTGMHHGGLFQSLKIYADFNSYKVQTRVRAQAVATDSNDDDFVMGYDTHPFMCANVDLKILERVKRKTDVLFEYSEFQGPFSGGGNVLEKTPRTLTTKYLVPLLQNFHVESLMEGEEESLLFQKCSDKGRTVLPCPSCVKTQPVGTFRWGGKKIFGTAFASSVTVMRQTADVRFPSAPRPIPHVTWTAGSTGVVRVHDDLTTTVRRSFPKTYARLISSLRSPTDWRTKLFLDNCVVVKRRSTFSSVPYYFDTSVCESATKRALCVRDYTKHSAQCGRLCDVCGHCARLGGVPRPNVTVFEAFPKALRSAYPEQHRIKDALVAGTLDEYVAFEDVDSDAVYEFFRRRLNESLVWSFPEARRSTIVAYSDRPGRETRGAVPDEFAWIDFDLFRMFPVDCGERCSRETGICRKRRAVSSEYCDPDAPQFSGGAMARSSIPKIFFPVPDDVDAAEERLCSTVVDPNDFDVRDEYGGPSPTRSEFVVLERTFKPTASILLKSRSSGTRTWSNYGKNSHGYVFRRNVTTHVRGSLVCSTACVVSVWISPLSSDYLEHSAKLVLGNVTGGDYAFDVTLDYDALGGSSSTFQNLTYQILGWDVHGLARASTIRLYEAKLSDVDSIAECRAIPFDPDDFVEIPSSIDSPEADNVCVFDEDQRERLHAAAVGRCHCGDPAYDGPVCDFPSIVTPEKDKRVCGGYGDPLRLVTAPSGARIRTNEYGVYSDGGVNYCACVNFGLEIRTTRTPGSAFGYGYVYVTDKEIGESEYLIVETSDYSPSVATSPADRTEVASICASESASRASFFTGDEADSFWTTSASVPIVLTDLILDADGDLRWEARNLLLEDCDDGCGRTLPNPCVAVGATPAPSSSPSESTTFEPTSSPTIRSYVVSDLCAALQWNNLVFGSTGDQLTDGTDAADVITATFYLTIASPVTKTTGVTVEIRVDESGSSPTVSFNNFVVRVFDPVVSSPACSAILPTVGDVWKFRCAVADVAKIEIGRTGSFGTVVIVETQVFDAEDDGRFDYYFPR